MRRIRLAAAVAAASLVVAGCAGADGSGGGDGALKIGAWYPLSGPVAASGVPSEAGARAYFDMLNDNGGINGRKVDFITEDTAFDPQQTLQVARQMVLRDGVQAIVTANGTAPTEATFPFVLDQSKVPIFGTYGGSTAWYEPGTRRPVRHPGALRGPGAGRGQLGARGGRQGHRDRA